MRDFYYSLELIQWQRSSLKLKLLDCAAVLDLIEKTCEIHF
jgi:hypothetical protein